MTLKFMEYFDKIIQDFLKMLYNLDSLLITNNFYKDFYLKKY